MNTKQVYKKWLDFNTKYLKELENKDFILAYSGGKDSSVLLFFLQEAKKEFNFSLKPFLYPYPKHRYNRTELEKLSKFWKQQGIEIKVLTSTEEDSQMKEDPNPCVICQKIRKKQLYKYIKDYPENYKNLVFIVGISLWDLTGYAINKLVVSSFLEEGTFPEEKMKERFIEIAQRFYPVTSLSEGYKTYRPMLNLNQQEINTVLKEKDIPKITTPCDYSGYRPKRLLSNFFEKFDYLMDYEKVFSFMKENFNLPDIEEYSKMSKEDYLLKWV